MNKLETFFINTVVAAQQHSKQTSGAVSTTKIGEFLAAEAVSDNILDKLVSTSLSQEIPAEAPPTEAVAPIETTQPDKELLSELTEPIQTGETRQSVPTQPVETDVTTPKDQVKEDVLDQLTGRSKTQTEKSQHDNTEAGESGDE